MTYGHIDAIQLLAFVVAGRFSDQYLFADGSMLVAPIIDKPNLGVWGGRFAAQWVSMVACACACYFLADSSGISKYIYAFIARGTIVRLVALARRADEPSCRPSTRA